MRESSWPKIFIKKLISITLNQGNKKYLIATLTKIFADQGLGDMFKDPIYQISQLIYSEISKIESSSGTNQTNFTTQTGE